MNGSLNPSSERLYLHKDENDEIFLESMLHQHHIDGIRFLYKQFKKNKLGVIINNPLGYGNSLQVALFLAAIRHILEKPILILCEQSEEMNWLEHFQKLTQCYNVGVGAENPFVKKSIFINTMERLDQFCRRDWSVMVVDNDAFLKEKALQGKFKADFKIWISPLDMKDHLETFSSIFKWLFPKDKLNIDDFKAGPKDRIDAISKSIILETFLEDIVFRTTLQTPFENPYEKCETPRKPTKKNKDATGTKIKRSKRPLEVTNAGNTSESNMEAETSAVKIPRTEERPAEDFHMTSLGEKEDKNKCDAKDNNSEVEIHIRNKQPIRFDPFSKFDNVSRQGSRTEFMNDEPMFDTAERLNRILESNICMDIAEDPESCFMDSDSNSNSLLPIAKVFENTFQLNNYSNRTVKKQSTPDFLTDNILNEIKEEMSENLDTPDENYKADVDVPSKDDVQVNNIQKELKKDEREVVKDEEVPKKNKEGIENVDEVKEEPDIVTKESDKVKESPNKRDLDAKLREMDERAFKKFHGSILDSLF